MLTLERKIDELNAKIDAMQASGNTNVTIGLVWGWQSLVGGGPLTVPTRDALR